MGGLEDLSIETVWPIMVGDCCERLDGMPVTWGALYQPPARVVSKKSRTSDLSVVSVLGAARQRSSSRSSVVPKVSCSAAS